MPFKLDRASLIVGSKFTIYSLFYFIFEGNFPSTSPWGAYTWRGLYMEGLIFGILRYVPWNDGIARQVQAPSHMFLLKVDYQLSFLKYLIHELVSQRHLLIVKC